MWEWLDSHLLWKCAGAVRPVLLPGSWWGGLALGRDGKDGSESPRCACRTRFLGSLCNRKSSNEDLLHKTLWDRIERWYEIGWGRTEELSHRRWPWCLPGFPATTSLWGLDPLAWQPVSHADFGNRASYSWWGYIQCNQSTNFACYLINGILIYDDIWI